MAADPTCADDLNLSGLAHIAQYLCKEFLLIEAMPLSVFTINISPLMASTSKGPSP
jgi:hypothetical protein